ncbi:hypothetical protein IF1G_06831 [Cordyceps javanica]|uniref:Uncharacterized protein n=1 Tax=Cordyceps javanica TaxID=43265 RepID=A0A545UZC2_9HYPO|nr:hypothetical protein IF1G_06831 [Cordyceps javanica]
MCCAAGTGEGRPTRGTKRGILYSVRCCPFGLATLDNSVCHFTCYYQYSLPGMTVAGVRLQLGLSRDGTKSAWPERGVRGRRNLVLFLAHAK